MTQGNKFPLAVGGNFYTSGSTGTSVATTFPFAGYLYTAAIYRRRLNQTEKTAVQAFLAARYNLWCPALSVPGAVGGTDPLNPNTCEATSACGTAAAQAPLLAETSGLLGNLAVYMLRVREAAAVEALHALDPIAIGGDDGARWTHGVANDVGDYDS